LFSLLKEKKERGLKQVENKKNLKEVPNNYNFEALKSSATQILADNSLAVMSALIRTSAIERDDKFIETACIGRYGRKLVIKYNGNFIYNFAQKPMEFAGVIAHEILHEILQHLDSQRYQGNQTIWNIAMDAIIQSTLSKLNRPPKRVQHRDRSPDSGFHITTVMEKMYPLEGVTALLRPPNPLRRIGRKEDTGDHELNSFRKKIYPEDGYSVLTEKDIYNFIVRKFGVEIPSVQLLGVFLGDEGNQNKGSGNIVTEQENENPEKDEQKNKKEQEKQEKQEERKDQKEEEKQNKPKFKKGIGDFISDADINNLCAEITHQAGHSTELTKKVTTLVNNKNKEVKEALNYALMTGIKSKIVSSIGYTTKPARSVVMPSELSKTDLVKLAGGYYPVFFSSKMPENKKSRVNIYLDVSGSCSKYIPWMYSCIKELYRIADVNCLLFSNKVVPITRAQLEKGEIISTGGTDFDCIVKHTIKEGDVQKAIIFTDGEANIEDMHVKIIQDLKIQYIAVIIPIERFYYNVGAFWETRVVKKFASQIFEIPQIES
jgi:predicted metal-dependent peptidase